MNYIREALNKLDESSINQGVLTRCLLTILQSYGYNLPYNPNDYVLHHISLDKTDNKLENFALMTRA